MENEVTTLPLSVHTVEICERKSVKITGVKKLDSFDEQEFLVETTMGYLLVTGTSLSLGKMDLENGILHIKGTIDTLKYVGKNKSPDKESLLKKLFK